MSAPHFKTKTPSSGNLNNLNSLPSQFFFLELLQAADRKQIKVCVCVCVCVCEWWHESLWAIVVSKAGTWPDTTKHKLFYFFFFLVTFVCSHNNWWPEYILWPLMIELIEPFAFQAFVLDSKWTGLSFWYYDLWPVTPHFYLNQLYFIDDT